MGSSEPANRAEPQQNSSLGASGKPNSGRPNFVLIMTDQQRRDSLGIYGSSYACTPNLDRLGREGACFDQCHVANPICMPSRASIFTGRYPHNHRTWTNGVLQPTELRTLAHQLKEQGYATTYVGKAHFNPFESQEQTPESAAYWRSAGADHQWDGPYWGFDHAELTIGHTLPLAHYGDWFQQRGGSPEMLKLRPTVPGDPDEQTGVTTLSEELHDSTFVGERAAAAIRGAAGKEEPFFLVASFPDPHHPFNPPAETAERFAASGVPGPVGTPDDLASRPEHYRRHLEGAWSRAGGRAPTHPGGQSDAVTKERIRLTHAMVSLIDSAVGEILGALTATGCAENTYVMFISDHGELLGDHGLWFKGPFFYNGLLTVPCLLRGPGVPAGHRSGALVSLLDLYPTICELLGVPVPERVDGISQAAVARGEEQTRRSRCLIEYRNGFGRETDRASLALVTDRYTFVARQGGDLELTDREDDPQERRNVACEASYLTVVDELRTELLDELLKTTTFSPPQVCFA